MLGTVAELSAELRGDWNTDVFGLSGKCRTSKGPATAFCDSNADFCVFFIVSIGFQYIMGYINIYLYFSLFCLR